MSSQSDFTGAYRTHARHVERYLRNRCGCVRNGESEDALQETFLAAWRIWDRRQTDNLRAWLCGIAKLVARKLRYISLMRPRPKKLGDYAVTAIEYDPAADVRSVDPAQESAVTLGQLRSKCFPLLGPAQASALGGIADGLTPLELATRDHKSLSAVTMALSLGRKRLREMQAV